jgi:enterochelin esterase family protein
MLPRFSHAATTAALLTIFGISTAVPYPVPGILSPAHAQDRTSAPANPAFTASELAAALSDRRRNNDDLARRVRDWVGADKTTQGAVKLDKQTPGALTLAWIIEAPGLKKGEEPMVVAEDGTFALRLRRLGKSDLYAETAQRPQGIAMLYTFRTRGTRSDVKRLEEYPRNPEEVARPEVPKGVLTQMPPFRSKVFAGTSRDWWVYVPSQYTPDKPAAVMVFQDGGDPKNWIPTVFDNMIAKGEIPVTVGVFINPGRFDDNRSNRSVEYDTLSDAYARMLLEEILPEVEKTTKLSHDPEMRVIYGVSSGGIAAFTVAWERPDEFRKVITAVGSFTNLQGGPTGTAGGNTYPAIIRRRRGWERKGEPKPIRVFMSDGANDLDNAAGSWPLANQDMDRALTYGGYDHKLVFGNGFHGGQFGRFLMPQSLRWVWSKPAAAAPAAQ